MKYKTYLIVGLIVVGLIFIGTNYYNNHKEEVKEIPESTYDISNDPNATCINFTDTEELCAMNDDIIRNSDTNQYPWTALNAKMDEKEG